MDITLKTSCDVGKSMKTSREKAGDDDIVTCSIAVKGVRISLEEAEEISGYPIGAWVPLFSSDKYPIQQDVQIILGKRALLATGYIEHRRDSGHAVAKLQFTKPAIVTHVRARLDTPDDKGATVMMSFQMTWKAAGDEVEDVEALLKRKCWLQMKLAEEPTTRPLMSDDKPNAAADAEVGRRAKLERKQQAAGEKLETADPPPEDVTTDELLPRARECLKENTTVTISKLQRFLTCGYNRAARLMEQLEREGLVGPMGPEGRAVLNAKGRPVTNLAEFKRDAEAHARKHPRRDPPKPPRGKR